MTERTKPRDCPKFSLLLKSHTRRKRLLEAKRELEGLYPFEVDEKNILILKTDKKGLYEIYISKETVKNELNAKKLCLAAIACVLAMVTLIFATHHAAMKNAESIKARKELERQRQEETRLLKEKEQKLASLEEEYDERKSSEYEKIYPCIERLYSAMPEKTTIESMSLEKNSFTVEATTKDAAAVLANFEKSGAFAYVKMSRTTVKDGVETVAYNGEFSRLWKRACETLSIDERIEFYETELSKIKARSEKMREAALSDYIKTVRAAMHKNGCGERNIQLRGNSDSAEIEFFIVSDSRGVLNFIKEIQEGEESLVDIKRLSIRNSENRNGVQTTICFDTGIELKQSDVRLSEPAGKSVEPSEMDRIFRKAPAPKTVASNLTATPKNANVKKTEKKSVPRQLKKLSFIGLTKIKGRDFVMAKDDDMGVIYKLAVTETETSGDFCVQCNGGYMAEIRGERYEVRR